MLSNKQKLLTALSGFSLVGTFVAVDQIQKNNNLHYAARKDNKDDQKASSSAKSSSQKPEESSSFTDNVSAFNDYYDQFQNDASNTLSYSPEVPPVAEQVAAPVPTPAQEYVAPAQAVTSNANQVDQQAVPQQVEQQAVPQPAEQQSETYIIKAEDTLYSISEKLGLPLDMLIQANGNSSMVYVGQVITYPTSLVNKQQNDSDTQTSSTVAETQPTSPAPVEEAPAATVPKAPAATPAPVTPDLPASVPANGQLTSQQVQDISTMAQQLANQGIPYVWGGGDTSGFDCSGLVQYVFRNAAGIEVPHNTVMQEAYFENTKPVSQAQPGDLLFWGDQGGTWHNAIYLGNGYYVQAPQPGMNVQVSNLSDGFTPDFAASYTG